MSQLRFMFHFGLVTFVSSHHKLLPTVLHARQQRLVELQSPTHKMASKHLFVKDTDVHRRTAGVLLPCSRVCPVSRRVSLVTHRHRTASLPR